MMKVEYPENRSCPQKDSAEHEEYAGAQSVGCREVAKQDGADLLERILVIRHIIRCIDHQII